MARIRSYLAQLTEGLPEQVAETSQFSRTHDTGLKIAGVGVDRKGERSTAWVETRTYGDVLVPLFEEHAEASGFLTDVTGDIEQPSKWRQGHVHEQLSPGALFRWTGTVRVFDASHMADSVRRLEGLVAAIAKLQPSAQRTKATGRTTPSSKSPMGR